jgi:hypothetical protein
MLARMWEKVTLTHWWKECKLVPPLWKTIWRLLKKLNIDLPYDPAIPLSAIPKGMRLRLFQRHLHTHVYCSIIHNSQDAPLPTDLRKCGIYTHCNFIQPQRTMKFCHLQENGWNWRTLY